MNHYLLFRKIQLPPYMLRNTCSLQTVIIIPASNRDTSCKLDEEKKAEGKPAADPILLQAAAQNLPAAEYNKQ
jgi:hypothetical protein